MCLYAANKSKVLWGIPRDPDVVAALQELEEEENEMVAEDEKPKVSARQEGGRGYVEEGGKDRGRGVRITFSMFSRKRNRRRTTWDLLVCEHLAIF